MKALKKILGLEKYISVREKYRKFKKALGLPTVYDGFPAVKKEALEAAYGDNTNQRAASLRSALGVNVIGYINSESGVGQSARGMILALKHANIPISVFNFDTGWHRAQAGNPGEFSTELPYAVNLCCFNAEETPYRMNQLGAEKLKGKYNIGLWAWELDKFPEEWNGAFEYVHEIWTISDFSKKSIEQATDLKITKVPLVVEPKVDEKFNRKYFNLPGDAYIFLFSFDGFSFADRKNPFATARAYAQAFQSAADTMLLIKTQNLDKGHEKKLHKILKGTNYRIINCYFNEDEFIGLLNSSDCYVSLHRAEGFGYGLAEAMYLRKTVIATNYSGNLDFMNESNSFLVPYKLVPVEKNAGPYKKGNHWAEADIASAVRIMRSVVKGKNSAHIREMKERAHAEIFHSYSSAQVGDQIRKMRDIGPLYVPQTPALSGQLRYQEK